ncbi:LON peptidase substrate-binding domain-containing protein [Actinomycetospora succinea]|uniref:LON peptidase substrate-binding domain-containing protein n=1 Tax=Actinomycetospora succinea TaxID=663603 RepID=UPI001FB85CC1|nr:LON peptidase substrate-binding domain-containing protein [Actinomycetospora succinea]
MVETLPLFPLGTVLLPGASLPLHIFEPRYRQLTIDLVTGTLPGKQFGVVAVREGWSPDDGRDGLHDVGCTATLREVRRLPDGRFDLQTTGDRRFRLVDVDDSTAPYLVANVEWLPDDEDEHARDLAPLAMAARAAHRRYCTTAWRQQGGGDGELPAELAEEPAPDVADPELAHILAGDCLLPLADRQELLEQTCPIKRLQLVRQSMTREAVLLDELRAVWAPTAKFAVDHSLN